jgi:hypothetical protein
MAKKVDDRTWFMRPRYTPGPAAMLASLVAAVPGRPLGQQLLHVAVRQG